MTPDAERTMAIPWGFSESGLPTDWQIAGRPFDEITALQVPNANENATDCHTRHPGLQR